MKKGFGLLFCAVLVIGFIGMTSLYVHGAENLSKEMIIESVLKKLAEESKSLGKYTLIAITATQIESGGAQLNINLHTKVTMNGFKKAAEQFIKADINGKPVTEEQYNQWQAKRQPKNSVDILGSLPEGDWANAATEKIAARSSFEGSDIIDGNAVYKLKIMPRPEEAAKLKESYVFIDKNSFQIVRMVMIGNQSNGESQVTINYQKIFQNYFMPVLVKIAGEGKNPKNQQDVSTNIEVKLADYQSL